MKIIYFDMNYFISEMILSKITSNLRCFLDSCISFLFEFSLIESEIKYELAKIIERSDISEILPECYLEVFKHISEQIERLL